MQKLPWVAKQKEQECFCMRWSMEGGKRGEILQISLVLAILSDLSNTITDSKDVEFCRKIYRGYMGNGLFWTWKSINLFLQLCGCDQMSLRWYKWYCGNCPLISSPVTVEWGQLRAWRLSLEGPLRADPETEKPRPSLWINTVSPSQLCSELPPLQCLHQLSRVWFRDCSANLVETLKITKSWNHLVGKQL